MADLFDYLKWRGDLSFTVSDFNEIDALILCQLAYIDFSDIISSEVKTQKSLKQVAEEFSTHKNLTEKSDLGLIINPKTIDLLYKTANSQRFSDILICGYESIYNLQIEEQFSAITFLIDKEKVFVAFRGTDDTIVGWKEDFNLAFKEVVPAQNESLSYLENVIDYFSNKKILVGGHSKGGNLAIYSAAHLNKKYQKKILFVYNFDGPGFLQDSLLLPNFAEILKRTKTFYPKGSIIGMLFHHQDDFFVVESDGFFVMQHDPFTWKLEGPKFQFCPELEKSSIFFHKTFNEWFINLEKSKREEFVETLFNALESTKASTNSELAANWLKNSGKIIKSFSDLDPEIKKSAGHTASEFFKLAGKNIYNEYKLF